MSEVGGRRRDAGPGEAGPVVLLPGFGGSARQPLLLALAERLSRLGHVCRVEVPPRGRLTPELGPQVAWLEEVLDGLRGSPVLVGRSFRGRICARVAARREVRALVLLGFPLRPPKKPRPLDEAALAAVRCPTLVVQGSRDELGPLPVLRRAARPNRRVSLHVLQGVGHGFGRRTSEALDATVAWLTQRG